MTVRRKLEITVEVDLEKGSRKVSNKALNAVVAEVGDVTLAALEDYGFEISAAKIHHRTFFLRHNVSRTLRRAKRKLKSVA